MSMTSVRLTIATATFRGAPFISQNGIESVSDPKNETLSRTSPVTVQPPRRATIPNLPGSRPVVVTPSGFGDRNRADQLDHAVLAHCARFSTIDADRQKSIGAPRRRR